MIVAGAKLWRHRPLFADEVPSLDAMLLHIRERDTIVLAGDSTGKLTGMLSAFFKNVYAFESSRACYYRARLNTVQNYNVDISSKALGHTTSLGYFDGNTFMEDVMGTVHTVELDVLKLQTLNAFVLDSRQDISRALSGAEGKIERFRPTIFTQGDVHIHGYTTAPLNGEWVAHIPRR